MPGPASHLTIIELQTARAQNDPQPFGGPVLDALTNHREHAALGTIGPDMIFWADWDEYTPVVNAIFDIYKTIDEVYEKLAAIWQPISDAIDKVANTLTADCQRDHRDAQPAERDHQSALIKLITDQIDICAFLKPDMQKPARCRRSRLELARLHAPSLDGRFRQDARAPCASGGDPALRRMPRLALARDRGRRGPCLREHGRRRSVSQPLAAALHPGEVHGHLGVGLLPHGG